MSTRRLFVTLAVAAIVAMPVAAAESPATSSLAAPPRLVVFEGFYRPT